MAKIYIEGEIKIVEDTSFQDAQTKQKVPYYTNYLQGSDGKLLKLGSREDFGAMAGKAVLVTAELRPDFNKPSLYRLSIVEVKDNG